MWRRGGSLLLVGLLVAAPARVWGQGGTVSQSYMETFTGRPTVPTAYRPPGWDVQIHSRDGETWQALEPMHAQHGPACEPPLATHPLGGDYPPHVFQCADHVMTAMQAGGYGIIYLTPPALVDFSAGEAVIRWDMSTLRTSTRDWVDVWITPVADNKALPLQPEFPEALGPPRRAIDIKMNSGGVAGTNWTSFGASVWREFQSTAWPTNDWGGYETWLTPDAARRDTFEIRLSRTHLKVGMPGFTRWWVDGDTPGGPLDWSQAVVQFGHHSYNPLKDCEWDNLPDPCQPNTWHWDNVSISPAVPFSITPLSPRHLGQETPTQTWALPAPSVPGAMLRFAASSNISAQNDAGIELSYDWGLTWQVVRPQPHPEFVDGLHSKSYWVPLPTGTTAVQVRGHGGWWGSYWRADDPHVWVMSQADVPTPQPTPTPLPPATLTALPTAQPTATPEPSPTLSPFTPTVVPSPTPHFTRTPLPPATGTPPPFAPTPTPGHGAPTPRPVGCEAHIYRDGHFLRVDWSPQPQQCR